MPFSSHLRKFHASLIVACALMSADSAKAAAVIEFTEGSTIEAQAVDGISVNDVLYDVTFGSNGAQATSPPASALTFLNDPADALDATQQIVAAFNAIQNVEEVRYEDFSTSLSHTNSQFSVIDSTCLPGCSTPTAPYSGDAGNRDNNSGPPWAWDAESGLGSFDGNVFALFTPVTVVSSVPEPASWGVAIMGLCTIGLFARRPKSRSHT